MVHAEGAGVVFSIFKFFPSQNRRGELVELLRSVVDLTRPSPGCVGCWLSEEDSLHSFVRYAEQWQTEEGLYEHIRSDLYRRLLAALELSKQQPEVKFYLCAESKGLDLVEAVRHSGKSKEANVAAALFSRNREPNPVEVKESEKIESASQKGK